MRNPTMPRARPQIQDDWQTAAAFETGSGCLAFYTLPPLAALVIAGFVALVALKSSLTPHALPMADSTMLIQTAAAPLVPGQVSAQLPDTGAVTPIWSFASDNLSSPSGLSPIF